MTKFGEIGSDLQVSAGQSIRRNASDTGFEAFTPGGGGGDPVIISVYQTVMQQHDSIADLEIEWGGQKYTNATYFTHSTDTNSEQITIVEDGWYDISYKIHYDQDDTARLNTQGYVTINGTPINESYGRDTYYRGVSYGKWGQSSGRCVVQLSADDVIVLHSGVADGNTDFTLTRAIDTVINLTHIQIRKL